jgi:hypothetical protein
MVGTLSRPSERGGETLSLLALAVIGFGAEE